MDVDARLEAIEAENERLRARVRELEEAMGMDFLAPLEFGLTGCESRVLGILLARDICTKKAIYAALYDSFIDDRDREPKIVDVFICKIRKKVRPFGVEILTVWGVGYQMDAAAKDLVRSFMLRAA